MLTFCLSLSCKRCRAGLGCHNDTCVGHKSSNRGAYPRRSDSHCFVVHLGAVRVRSQYTSQHLCGANTARNVAFCDGPLNERCLNECTVRLPRWRCWQRRGTRCLATVINMSGFEAQAGRIIVSGYSGVRFDIKFSGRHRGLEGVLFNL